MAGKLALDTFVDALVDGRLWPARDDEDDDHDGAECHECGAPLRTDAERGTGLCSDHYTTLDDLPEEDFDADDLDDWDPND